MHTLGKIVMYSAEDICKAFHVSKETAYKILDNPKAKVVELGRKKLIAEDNLLDFLSAKIKI